MCGIFGIVYKHRDRHVEESLVVEATNSMSHRGPDGWGIHVDGHVGLGHRRLSIIDLESGRQPMANQSGSLVVVFNGEIFNFVEIRETLSAKGYRFRTQSDTEVILHAYEEWGTQCVSRFNGMFAFLLWDVVRQSLWIVRDRLGIKPLYYIETKDGWCFASEVKALQKSGLITRGINYKVLDAYFSLGYVPGPETMFDKVYKVQPGHYHVLREGRLDENIYWDFNHIEPSRECFEEALFKTQDLLLDSIRKRLISDVPLGVFLSGGLDSSALTALMKEIVSDPIQTFTVGYGPSAKISEEPYAQLVAKHLNTDHHVFQLGDEDFFTSLGKLIEFGEEPIVEPAGIALYHLAKLAREKVTVILSGEGSDEIFGGYHIYARMMQFEKIRRSLPPIFFKLLSNISNPFKRLTYSKNYDWLKLPLEQRFNGTSAILTDSLRRNLYSEDFFLSKGDYLKDTFAGYFNRVAHQSDILNKMLYVDSKTWLVDNLFVKADKMTMAASVELRVPFLDYRLVELIASYPHNYKMANNKGKILLKKIMHPYLPEKIINRQKMGFPVPTADWFRDKLFNLVDERLRNFHQYGFFTQKTINYMLKQHKSGAEDFSRIIMTLLVLDEWIGKHG